jgi:hypothetical protein
MYKPVDAISDEGPVRPSGHCFDPDPDPVGYRTFCPVGNGSGSGKIGPDPDAYLDPSVDPSIFT